MDSRSERIIVVMPLGRTASLACQALAEAGLHGTACSDTEALARNLEAGAGAVLLLEEALTPDVLGVLSQVLESQPAWSDLPVVLFMNRQPVFHGEVDRVLGLHRNVTILERPVTQRELVSVMHAALRGRRRQYEMRDLMTQLKELNDTLEGRVRRKTDEVREAGERLKQVMVEYHRLEQENLEISTQERQWFAQELHDGLCQQLSSLSFMIALLKDRVKEDPESAERVEQITLLARRSIREARALARGLFPLDLSGGLVKVLHKLADQTQKAYNVDCVLDASKGVDVEESSQATHLYRITQEALSNAIRHGQARHIIVTLTRERGSVVLRIKDDGVGIEEQPVASGSGEGIGMQTMQRRARAIGAVLCVQSGRSAGTVVECRLQDESALAPSAGLLHRNEDRS